MWSWVWRRKSALSWNNNKLKSSHRREEQQRNLKNDWKQNRKKYEKKKLAVGERKDDCLIRANFILRRKIRGVFWIFITAIVRNKLWQSKDNIPWVLSKKKRLQTNLSFFPPTEILQRDFQIEITLNYYYQLSVGPFINLERQIWILKQ